MIKNILILSLIFSILISYFQISLFDVYAEDDTKKNNINTKTEITKKIDYDKVTVNLKPININGVQIYKSRLWAFMRGEKVTTKSTNSYKILNNENVSNDNNLLKFQDRFLIAVGPKFSNKASHRIKEGYNKFAYDDSFIGTNIDVYLSNGNILKCVVGDVKNPFECLKNNGYAHDCDGSVIEFICTSDFRKSIKYLENNSKIQWTKGVGVEKVDIIGYNSFTNKVINVDPIK